MPWYSSNNMPAPFNQGQAPQGQAQQGMGIDPQMLTKAINAYMAMMGGGGNQQMGQLMGQFQNLYGAQLPPGFSRYMNGLYNNYSERGANKGGGAFGYGDGPGYGGWGGGGMGPTSMGIAQQYGWE